MNSPVPAHSEFPPRAGSNPSHQSYPSDLPEYRILVSAIPGQLEFAIKRGEEIVSRHDAVNFAEIRGYEIRAGIWHVTVDGPDTPALRQAILTYGWHPGPSLSALNAFRSPPVSRAICAA